MISCRCWYGTFGTGSCLPHCLQHFITESSCYAECGLTLSCWNKQDLLWKRPCLLGSICFCKTCIYGVLFVYLIMLLTCCQLTTFIVRSSTSCSLFLFHSFPSLLLPPTTFLARVAGIRFKMSTAFSKTMKWFLSFDLWYVVFVTFSIKYDNHPSVCVCVYILHSTSTVLETWL